MQLSVFSNLTLGLISECTLPKFTHCINEESDEDASLCILNSSVSMNLTQKDDYCVHCGGQGPHFLEMPVSSLRMLKEDLMGLILNMCLLHCDEVPVSRRM